MAILGCMATRRSQQKIRYQNRYIEYEMVHHPRARHLKVAVGIGGKITVTKPRWAKQTVVEKFVRERQPWIDASTAVLAKKYGTNENLAVDDQEHFLKYKDRALRLCEDKVAYWNRKK